MFRSRGKVRVRVARNRRRLNSTRDRRQFLQFLPGAVSAGRGSGDRNIVSRLAGREFANAI